MTNLEKGTLNIKTVIILITSVVSIITTVIITALSTVSSLKDEIKSVKTYSETEMRIINLRLDALETKQTITDKTLELVAKSLGNVSKYIEYQELKDIKRYK